MRQILLCSVYILKVYTQLQFQFAFSLARIAGYNYSLVYHYWEEVILYYLDDTELLKYGFVS